VPPEEVLQCGKIAFRLLEERRVGTVGEYFDLRIGENPEHLCRDRRGDFVVKPRGIEHTFWNAGDEPGRLLELISPAGFEDYFREMAAALAAPERAEALTAAIARRYGLDIDVGTIPVLAERHGLRLA